MSFRTQTLVDEQATNFPPPVVLVIQKQKKRKAVGSKELKTKNDKKGKKRDREELLKLYLRLITHQILIMMPTILKILISKTLRLSGLKKNIEIRI